MQRSYWATQRASSRAWKGGHSSMNLWDRLLVRTALRRPLVQDYPKAPECPAGHSQPAYEVAEIGRPRLGAAREQCLEVRPCVVEHLGELVLPDACVVSLLGFKLVVYDLLACDFILALRKPHADPLPVERGVLLELVATSSREQRRVLLRRRF